MTTSKDNNNVNDSQLNNYIRRYEPRYFLPSEQTTATVIANITILHVIKGSLGTGCLTLPWVFSEAGILIAIIGITTMSCLFTYTMHILILDIEELTFRYDIPDLTYSEAMELAALKGPQWIRSSHKKLSVIVDVVMAFHQFGVASVYIAFVAKNLKRLGDFYFTTADMRLYIAGITLPLLLIFLGRAFHRMLKLANFAYAFILIGIIIIIGYMFEGLPNLSNRHAIESSYHSPALFGTMIFSFESTNIIIALQKQAKQGSGFASPFGIFQRGMFIVLISYLIFGFLGYWQFGEATEISVLQNLPIEDILAQCAAISMLLGMFMLYSLQGFVALHIIWARCIAPFVQDMTPNQQLKIEYLCRTALVVGTVLMAFGTPHFYILMSFFGSFCLTQLSLIYPAIIDLCLWYNNRRKKVRSVVLITIGLMAFLAGTITAVLSIKELYEDMNNI